jgi:integrase
MSKLQWQRTKKKFLLRDKISDRYYARFFSDGKQHWISLKTDSFVVAEAKLAQKLKEFKKARKTSQSVEQGTATVEQVARTYLDNQKKRPEIKVSTAHYREQLVTAILETRPELKSTKPRDISESDCQTWASRFAAEYSPTRYNNAVDTLRGIFRTAIDHGMIYRNPAETLGKRRPNKKHLSLPRSDEFSAIVKSVREQGAWCSKQCGDLIEFLAFSGCRLDEAKHIRWSDFTEDGVWIHGGETGTKSHGSRFLPFNPALKQLMDNLREHPRYYRGEPGQARFRSCCETCGPATEGRSRHISKCAPN